MAARKPYVSRFPDADATLLACLTGLPSGPEQDAAVLALLVSVLTARLAEQDEPKR